jgi:hypothetical protein
MAEMQGPGWVGRDVFDIDGSAGADLRAPPGLAGAQHVLEPRPPEAVGEPKIDEAWAGDLDGGDAGSRAKLLGHELGQLARRHAGGLGQHHGRVGCDIPMLGFARWLGGDLGQVEARGQAPLLRERAQHAQNLVPEMAERVHSCRE